MLTQFRLSWPERLAALSRQRCLLGASLFRIGAGLTILYQYLSTYSQRRFLYGPDAVVPFELFVRELARTHSFSLYALDPSPVVFELLFHLSIVIAIVWVLGWQTRLMTLLTWVCLWSLHTRNPSLWDGGDNLVRIVLLYSCCADLGAYASLDAERRRRRGVGEGSGHPTLGLLHNIGLLACGLQLCLVYGVAGLSKVAGELWRNGTALYYIVRVGEFAWTGYGAALYHHGIVIAVLTYSTVAFQVSFPFLFFAQRATRRLALMVGIGFHVGIGLILGLVSFAAFMISIELLFVPDRDYLAALRACRRLGQALAASGEQLHQRHARWQ